MLFDDMPVGGGTPTDDTQTDETVGTEEKTEDEGSSAM